MKLLIYFCLLFIGFLINGNHSLPSESFVKHCKICKNLVNFTKNVSSFNDENNGIIFNSLINWCHQYKLASDQYMCSYLLKSLEPAKDHIISDGFCENIGACINDERLKLQVNEKETIKNDVSCEFCVNTFSHIKEILTSNETENEIKYVLAQSCNYLNKFKNECLLILDQNIDDIFDFLRSNVDAKKICDSIGFCSNNLYSINENNNKIETKQRIPDIMEIINIGPIQSNQLEIKSKFGPECLICKKVLLYVYDYIRENKTQESIKDGLDRVCGELFNGPRRDECDQLVDKYYPDLVRAIELATEPEIACSLLGLCVTVTVEEKPNCILCENVIKYIYTKLENNMTEEKIREELDLVCNRLMPVSERVKCISFVNQYTDMIVKLILQEASPQLACKYLGLCSASKFKPLTRVTLKATKVGYTPLTLLKPAEVLVRARLPVSRKCKICKNLFEYVNSQVKGTKDRHEIRSAVSVACNSVRPFDDRGVCLNFIEDNKYRIIDIFTRETNPENAYRQLETCLCIYPEESNKIKWAKVERNEADESDLTEIKVNKYNGEQDDNREPYNPTFLSKASNEDTVCYTCQVVAHFIQEQLYNNDTEVKINQFIEKHLCMLINSYGIAIADDKCYEFINSYGPMIEQMIAQKYFDASTLCFNRLKLCTKKINEDNNNDNDKFKQIQFELIKPEKQKTCEICVETVNGLDEILSKIPVEKNLTIISDKVCRLLPDNEINECKKIITTFGSYLIQLIDRLNDAYKVCHAVDLCMIPGQVHLLGAHKCTFGPTYWCHTIAHAEACKATDYCKSNIWQPIIN